MEYSSPRQIWDAVLGELQIQVSKSNYRTWLEKTTGLERHDNQFIVAVPNIFVAEYLDKNQRSLIEKTLIGILHEDVNVSFQVNGSKLLKSGTDRPALMPPLNANYTFESFVVGNENNLAYAASKEVADNPGKSYNPFFICGGHGLGKTHLLQAIGHEAIAKNLRILYASGEQYTNEFLTSLRDRQTEEFRNKYRSVEMLLLDDIGFISGKEQTEESLFHTLNHLQNANKQIVVTSDRTLQEMQLGDKLRSRLEGGLEADIRSPELETRLAILKVKAKQKGIEITPETADVIAQNIRQNIRELEGSLNRVVAYAKLIRNEITPELAAHALESIGTQQEKPEPALAQTLIQAVAASFRISPEILISQKRDKDTALARQVAMYVLKQEMNCSLAQVGKELGGRNPATVTHGCQKIADELNSNNFLRDRLAEIQERIKKA